MRILLTNDDGIHADGLAALERIAARLSDDVWVVAPEYEQSGASRALTLEQIQQNFAAGVGERYFLLFNVTQLTGVPQSYIMFEVSQYDSYSYLFTKPVFISLSPSARPGSIAIEGIRIGVNGGEAHTGQAYANVNTTVTDGNYSATSGQLLSEVGTIIGLQKGPVSDQFFLTFDRIGSNTYARTPVTGVTQVPVDLDWDTLTAMGVSPVRGAFIDEAEAVRHNPSLLAAAIMTWFETLAPSARVPASKSKVPS